MTHVVLWICLTAIAQPVWANTAAIVGGGDGLAGWVWWVRPEIGREAGRDAVAVSVVRLDDEPAVMLPPRKVSGRVRPWAAAASSDGRTLWLAFDTGEVTAWHLRDGGVHGVGLEARTAAALSGTGRVRAMTVAGGVPWVLWHAERASPTNGDATTNTPTPETDPFVERVLLLKLPPESIDAPPRDDATPTPEDPGADPAPAPVADADTAVKPEADPPRDVLLRLGRHGWESVPLPADWPEKAAVALLPGGSEARPAAGETGPGDSSNPGAGGVVLVARVGEGMTVWRGVAGGDGSWRAESFPFPGRRGWSAAAVAGQVLIVTDPESDVDPDPARGADADPAQSVWALRAGRAVKVGAFPQATESAVDPTESGVAGVGQSLVRLVVPAARAPQILQTGPDAEPQGRLWAMDVTGRLLRDEEPVTIQKHPSKGPPPSQTVLMAVLMASTVVMLVFWRRDPAGQRFQLPAGATVAALDRRAVAGAIDLSVGFAAAWWWFDLGPMEVLDRWPGRADALGWSAMLPALVCVAVVTVHTAVAEALTGRSLGKALTGLRVVDAAGRPARGWRGLVRCGLKVLDLVAYLLLILIVVSPLRQRLGDLVAGTVVVMNAAGPEDSSSATD